MSSAYRAIAFTNSVKSQQENLGSRSAYAAHEQDTVEDPNLGFYEIEFIQARDSFYLGSVGETGWPYVQHRGGPMGFLKVLDSRTIGFADYTGNRQYISTGNIAEDNRVSLFLMDYPNQVRLKMFGRIEVVTEGSNPALLQQLQDLDFRARVERGMVVHIEGFDWNCPKYITPRYTQDEVAKQIQEAISEVDRSASSRTESAIGIGELELSITGVRSLTPRIRAYELRSPDWSVLPAATPGAHLEVPVRLSNGSISRRQYSLTTTTGQSNVYEIAVLLDEAGRGGSKAIHETWRVGTRLRVSPPINHFPLHEDETPAVLIAGGIGITPIKAMAESLKQRNANFEVHFTAKTPADMAFHQELLAKFSAEYHPYFSRTPNGSLLNIDEVVNRAVPGAVFYVCGPLSLINAVVDAASRFGIEPARVRYESFS